MSAPTSSYRYALRAITSFPEPRTMKLQTTANSTSQVVSRTRQWLSDLLPSSGSRSDKVKADTPILTCQIPHSLSSAVPPTDVDHLVKPPPAVTKTDSVPLTDTLPCRTPTDTELDEIRWGQRLEVPDTRGPPTPAELESNSHPATPTDRRSHEVAAITLPTVKQPYMNRWRIPVLCLAFFIQGLNDSVPGALLPSMERYYEIRYAIVSLIFVGNAVGFILAAPVCHLLNNRFGRAKVLSACALLNALAYIALVCQPPWPVVVIAFLLLGFGLATILALDNVFIINLQGGTVLLGYMHGCYGIGGICSPFMATAMVSSGIRWSFFYFIPLALSLSNAAGFAWSFKGYEQEPASGQLLTALERSASRDTTHEKASILRKAIKNRTTLLGALLIFAYQGAEVSISGWVISFLIDYRNGDPSQVGYVTSGFWGGITLGRFILVTPAHKFGDRISIVVLIAGTAAFQFMVWFLPNVIGNAVAVAFIGFLLGPIYPCATGVFSKLLPRQLQITSLGFISSMGSSGGAIAPFFTGMLAQKLGTVVLNPICIALCVVMVVAWLGLPKVVKRTE